MKYPPELKEKALELLRSGKGIAEVSRELGIPYYTLKSWARNAGIRLAEAKRYPPEVREKALELLKQGLTYREVANQLGLPISTIERWAHAAGIRRGGVLRRYPKELKEKALEMLRQGLSAAEVARELGINYVTVLNWAYAAGLRARGSGASNRYPPELREKAVRLVKHGLSYSETAALLGVSEATVREWCIKAGVRSVYAIQQERALTKRRALSPEERKAAILRVVEDFEREKGVEGLAKCAEEAITRSEHLISGRAPLSVAGALIYLCAKLIGKDVPVTDVAFFLAKYPGLGKTVVGIRDVVKAWLAYDSVFKRLQEQGKSQAPKEEVEEKEKRG
jgi:transposase-like protein